MELPAERSAGGRARRALVARLREPAGGGIAFAMVTLAFAQAVNVIVQRTRGA